MNTLVILLAVIGVAVGLPQGFGRTPAKHAPAGAVAPPSIILKQAQNLNPDGSYEYSYETDTGISAQESGYLKNAGRSDEAQIVQGTFSYTSPDGTPITLHYSADEEGFKAEGAHLPQGPPIPELILRALAYNAAHAEEEAPGKQGVHVQQAKRRF